MQNIVSSCEKALKLVSDQLTDADSSKPLELEKRDPKKDFCRKPEPKVKKEEKKEEPPKDQ